ncbi:MAG: alpha/beta hydrolase [Oscillospiraceae bacterium]|nr:alpha/beta hydrolase [Oscillospiraceae bacterium]
MNIYEINSPFLKGIKATLTAYPTPIGSENSAVKRPAVIICPGGSYHHCSYREGRPVALRYQAYGMSAFVLEYSVDGKTFPAALCELAEAVRFVRENAEKWYVDPTKIIVCGFSAGAHLAASLAVHYDSDFMKDIFGDADIRPFAQILSYPVITSGEYSHKGSIRSICGETPSRELLERVSLEKQVDSNTPPAFIWHCTDDKTVPVQNSIMYMNSLSMAGVSFEAHIYPEGGHGIALCDDTALKNDDMSYLNENASQWFNASLNWIRRICSVKYR